MHDEFEVGGGFSKWSRNIGTADATGHTIWPADGKSLPLEEEVSAGALLLGLEGRTVLPGDTLGFDINVDSPCTAGPPRFNVSYTVDESSGLAFLGCGEGSTSPTSDPFWRRVRIALRLPEGAMIDSVVLMVDEPADVLDNVEFRDTVADTPTPFAQPERIARSDGPESFCLNSPASRKSLHSLVHPSALLPGCSG